MQRDAKTEVIVGLFVVTGLALFIGAFLMLGSDNPLLQRSYRLHCSFANISGLREGAAVRVAGMQAGQVVAIRFPANLSVKEVEVELQIDQAFQNRIWSDSVAKIATEGLLGDKYIAISVGSPVNAEGEPNRILEHGDPIQRINPRGMEEYLAKADVILDNIEDSTEAIKVVLEGPEGEAAGVALMDIFDSLRNVVKELEQGQGILHSLVYDKEPSRRLNQALVNLDEVTASLDRVMVEVEDGDGTAHALIYEHEAARMIEEIANAADEIDGLVEDIKAREGLVHSLVYDEGEQNLLVNLTEASQNLREVTRMIRDGEGTLGALVTDPTVYEDLQTLLGRAERNKILKEYVRRTIRANELQEGLGGTELE